MTSPKLAVLWNKDLKTFSKTQEISLIDTTHNLEQTQVRFPEHARKNMTNIFFASHLLDNILALYLSDPRANPCHPRNLFQPKVERN